MFTVVEVLPSAISKAQHGLWRSLELAHQSLVGGGLPVGAVLLGADGSVLGEGRNRAYDPAVETTGYKAARSHMPNSTRSAPSTRRPT
jgi:tRNA(Arg) A34 adenosine deaminase TadA